MDRHINQKDAEHSAVQLVSDAGVSGTDSTSPEPTVAPAGLAAPVRADLKFLTVAEVAAMMRVSKMTVYRLVHDGRLPALQVGRSFRIPEGAVAEYLRDSYVQAG